eukprot:3541201-Amphidinium_carterae.2
MQLHAASLIVTGPEVSSAPLLNLRSASAAVLTNESVALLLHLALQVLADASLWSYDRLARPEHDKNELFSEGLEFAFGIYGNTRSEVRWGANGPVIAHGSG